MTIQIGKLVFSPKAGTIVNVRVADEPEAQKGIDVILSGCGIVTVDSVDAPLLTPCLDISTLRQRNADLIRERMTKCS